MTEGIPYSFTVTATDKSGVIHYEQTFECRAGFDAKAAAEENARRIKATFPECLVTVAPNTEPV